MTERKDEKPDPTDLTVAMTVAQVGQVASRVSPWAAFIVALVTGTVKEAIDLLKTVAGWGQWQFAALVATLLGFWAVATLSRRQARTLQERADEHRAMGEELLTLRKENRDLRAENGELRSENGDLRARVGTPEPVPGANVNAKVGR